MPLIARDYIIIIFFGSDDNLFDLDDKLYFTATKPGLQSKGITVSYGIW